ncbi:MAG: dockerin type I repeat-containing protein, partial [Clostridia bacterium]|nr:dockerin type I repeat-containing protein [Clostridia bacterium]
MKLNVKRLVSLTLATAVTVCSLAINGSAASTYEITSVNFTNDGTYLTSVYAGCTTVHVDAGIDQKGSVKFFRDGTEIEAGTKVVTGDTIKLYRNNSVKQTLSIVVSGDVNCDGAVTAADLLYAQMAILGVNSLEGAPLMAAKMSGGSSLSAADLVAMRQYVLGFTAPTVMDGFYNSDGYINAVPVYVGTPAFERYDNSAADIIFARNPWDMQTYNGKVYIGSGDYNSNKAPSLIACYDPETDKATVFQDRLDDEQVSNFAIIDGRLIAAGIDP